MKSETVIIGLSLRLNIGNGENMVQGCRTSGNQTASALIFSGQCKLVSIHATNVHADTSASLILYDNTAASGTVVATMSIGAGLCMEFDMHGVKCENGLYLTLANGTPHVTVEYA